jgi:hypothetical protein
MKLLRQNLGKSLPKLCFGVWSVKFSGSKTPILSDASKDRSGVIHNVDNNPKDSFDGMGSVIQGCLWIYRFQKELFWRWQGVAPSDALFSIAVRAHPFANNPDGLFQPTETTPLNATQGDPRRAIETVF